MHKDYPKGPVWVRFLSDRVFDPVFDPVFGGFFEHLAKMKHAHSKPESVFSECSVQCSMGLFRTVPLRSGLGPVCGWLTLLTLLTFSPLVKYETFFLFHV